MTGLGGMMDGLDTVVSVLKYVLLLVGVVTFD
jgi:hypothetical protein